MSKRNLMIAIIWVACGFYNWGTMMADMKWESENRWTLLHKTARDYIGISGFVAIVGPFGTPLAFLVTNFNQHGWMLWWKDKP